MATEIVRHPDRYALVVDGDEVGELDYHDRPGTRVMPHVGVRPSHRNRGLAEQLTRHALAEARAEGLAVDPVCPYVAALLRRHPELATVEARPR